MDASQLRWRLSNQRLSSLERCGRYRQWALDRGKSKSFLPEKRSILGNFHMYDLPSRHCDWWLIQVPCYSLQPTRISHEYSFTCHSTCFDSRIAYKPPWLRLNPDKWIPDQNCLRSSRWWWRTFSSQLWALSGLSRFDRLYHDHWRWSLLTPSLFHFNQRYRKGRDLCLPLSSDQLNWSKWMVWNFLYVSSHSSSSATKAFLRLCNW